MKENGVNLIAKERDHQLRLFYLSAHDDQHIYSELAVAAAELAVLHVKSEDLTLWKADAWGLVKKHGHDPVKALTIAGALIAAEIDRLLRLRVNTEQP